MKKILLFTFLIILNCLVCQRPPKPSREQNMRDFISGFFNELNGNFTLDENCVGKETKQNINDLIDAFHNKQIFKIIDNARNIFNTTIEKCPIDETVNYIETKFFAIKDGYYFENFKKNIFNIAEIIIHEINNKQKTAYSIGTACAKIEKLTIFRQANQLTFLALEENNVPMDIPDLKIDLDGFKKFFKGLLEGVSSVPFDKNVCYTSTVNIKIEEIKVLAEKLYKAIKDRSGEEFYNVVMEILAILEKLQDLNNHCNIKGLIKSIGVYATPYVGIAKLIYNIARHYDDYYQNIMDGYHSFANQEWENAGQSIGKFVSTFLNWSTS